MRRRVGKSTGTLQAQEHELQGKKKKKKSGKRGFVRNLVLQLPVSSALSPHLVLLCKEDERMGTQSVPPCGFIYVMMERT